MLCWPGWLAGLALAWNGLAVGQFTGAASAILVARVGPTAALVIERGLRAVTRGVFAPMVIAVHPSTGATTLADLVNMGFNRWAADLTGSATWLDPASGYEVSMAAGFTFNGNNPATDYRTGTEFHLESALMKHMSKDFAFGAAGYYYRQMTGDSGSGAVLGSFKGEVAAIGPNITYNFNIGKVHVLSSVRWLHEVKAVNRARGDAGFLTLTIPFAVASAVH